MAHHPEMQILTARQSRDTWNGYPTWNVYSDELGFLGNYPVSYGTVEDEMAEAIELAREDLL